MSKIPDGYTSITPFIVFDDPAAAIELYKKAFDVEINVSLPAADGNIMFAEIQMGSARLMMGPPCSKGGNGNPSAKSLGGSPICFYVYVEDVQTSFKRAQEAGMTEKTNIEDMFWGDRMGTLTDPFGIDWTIAEHVRDVSPKEMEEALQKME